MADNNQIQGLPAGVTLDPTPHDAASVTPQVTGLPAGVTLDSQPHDTIQINPDTATDRTITIHPDVRQIPADPKQWTKEDLEYAKAKSQIPGVNYTPTHEMTGTPGLAGVATGLAKNAAATVAGAANLTNEGINAVVPGANLPMAPNVSEPKGTAEKLGGVAEQGLEWAEGDAAIEQLAKLANIAKNAPELLQLIKEHPVASKIILGTLKGAAVGGTQGATQASGKGENVKTGAESGAAGGAVGGTVAEAAPEVLPKIAKMLGVGGQTFESAMAKAGRPAVSDRNWKQSLDLAKPILLDNIDPKSVKSIDDFVDQIGTLKNDIWTNDIAPPVKKWANAPVTTTPIASEIRSGITRSMLKHFPEDAAEMERMSNNFVGNSTIGELAEDLETFNAKLKSYYKMDPQARAAAGKTDGQIAGMERAADGMRDLLFEELEARGEKMPAEMRNQYGALADVERIFTKRIPVADRQGPMNLAQILSLAAGAGEATGAVMSGHPLEAIAGAVPIAVTTAAKIRSTPESLIRQGLNAGIRESGPGPIKSAAGEIAKTAVGSGGSQASQDISKTGLPHHQTGEPIAEAAPEQFPWTRMALPNNQGHVEVHPEDVEDAKSRGLTVVS